MAAGGPTVAVLACGVDRAYPMPHRDLLEHLAATGAVVSRAAAGLRTDAGCGSWPATGVIAALTRGTVVVEAAMRSGALNTAHWAISLSRPLMGVPGPVTQRPVAGGPCPPPHGRLAGDRSGRRARAGRRVWS